MGFPTTPHVVYSRPPLDLVVSQLRFPTILSIDTTPPADFQKRIRHQFPEYEEKREIEIMLGGPPPMPGAEVQLEANGLSSMIPQTSITKNHEFRSEDGSLRVNLTRNFLALTATDYTNWDAYRTNLRPLVEALLAEYEPSHFSRVGLRYVNLIRREDLGVEGLSWGELLNPAISGLLGTPEAASLTKEAQATHLLEIPHGVARIRTGLKSLRNSDGHSFLIDADFYTESKTATARYESVLDAFNDEATRFFTWCLEEQLLNAMEPSKP